MAWSFGMDGIEGARSKASDARGPFRNGEPPVVTAARGVVRDHERDPADGTMRTFGGRDEARLESAITRIDPAMADVAEIRGILRADVAIQSMAAARVRHMESGKGGPTPFDAKDVRAVRGDTGGVEAMGRVELGNVMTGAHDRVGTAAADWMRDVKSFAGRQERFEDRPLGEGARMAMTGGFARSARTGLAHSQIEAYRDHGFVPRPSTRPPLSEQAAGLGLSGARTVAVGPADRSIDVAAAHAARDGSKSR